MQAQAAATRLGPEPATLGPRRAQASPGPRPGILRARVLSHCSLGRVGGGSAAPLA